MNTQPGKQQNGQQQIPPQITTQLQINQMDWIIQPYVDPKTKTSKGGLAISTMKFCQNKQKMQKQQFKAVLSVCGDKLVLPVKVQHLWIVIDDHPQQNISLFFKNSYGFIERNRQVGNVLVHCRAGISRSSSIVVAYLIKKNNMNFQQALQVVRACRPHAYPNKGFSKQLKRYANQILSEIKEQNNNNKNGENQNPKCSIF